MSENMTLKCHYDPGKHWNGLLFSSVYCFSIMFSYLIQTSLLLYVLHYIKSAMLDTLISLGYLDMCGIFC